MGKDLSVVFDIGNVLVEWDPRNLYRKLFDGDDQAMEWFIANVCDHQWNLSLDAGRPFKDAVYEKCHEYPEFRELIEAYDHRWDEMLSGPIQGTVDILEDLRAQKTPVYGLSNWSMEKYPVGCDLFPFLKTFDGVVISGDVKLVKPDPQIYRLLLNKFELAPEKTIFIDDRPENVESARDLGIQAFLFKTPEKFRQELERLEVLKS